LIVAVEGRSEIVAGAEMVLYRTLTLCAPTGSLNTMAIFLGRPAASVGTCLKPLCSEEKTDPIFFIGCVLACPMPNAEVTAKFCFITRSGKVLTARFTAKEVLIETRLLCAGRRDFDIKSNRRRMLTLIHPLLMRQIGLQLWQACLTLEIKV
jgi:hypothetical protein